MDNDQQPNPPQEEEEEVVEEEDIMDEEEIRQMNHLRGALFARVFQLLPGGGAGGEGATNEQLIARLKRQGALTSASVEKAMLDIPRGYFVTEDMKQEAYDDAPQRFAKMGFNISAPHMYAVCLDRLNVEPGDIVLDIGSGSGHFTALCAYLAGPSGFAYGIDIHQHIVDFSSDNIKKVEAATKIQLPNVKFLVRNCFLPDPEEILYDRIHVGACCPESYLTQLFALLKPKGIIVTPFGDRLLKATKNEDGSMSEETLMNVRYSDLIIPSDAEVIQAKKECARVRARRIKVPPQVNMSASSGKFLSEEGSDVCFIVNGTRLPAHTSVVSTRSEVFKAMLSNGMLESQNHVVRIEDQEIAAFTEVLRFCYTDECNLDADNIVGVLELANYYKFDRLVAMCEEKLRDMLDIESAASILSVADRFNARQIFSCAREYIYENVAEVVKTQTFAQLDPLLMNQLFVEAVKRANSL